MLPPAKVADLVTKNHQKPTGVLEKTKTLNGKIETLLRLDDNML